IDPKTGKALTPFKPVWSGTGGRYVEGSHIYKKDGYYYLLCSEGGTELAHSLTIARSRNIYGPYESNPDNPIMTNCRAKGQDKQIQGTGHGDFVQAKDGSWWIVFLAYRNMGGSYHHLGRETCLAPVEWRKGEWPVIYGGEAIDTLMTTKLLPQHSYPSKPMRFTEDDPAWVYLQNPDSSKYQWMTPKQGDESEKSKGELSKIKVLRLYGSESSLTQNNRPTYIGRRQEAEQITCEVCVDLHQQTKLEAGISVYQINDGHYDLFVENNKDTGLIVGLRYQVKGLPVNTVVGYADQMGHSVKRPVYLRVQSADNLYVFSYSFDGKNYQKISALPSTLLSTEVVGGFTGVTLGMYACGNGYADFTKWKYEEN
ncbi:MAG: family 43 glycosylhydrolase, partial [Prevotella sp.]